MSLSLEYIGKFVIVLVSIAVGIGLIVSLQGDVDGLPGIGNGGEGPEAELVDISDSASEVASLVRMCYTESRERQHENFVCFIARTEVAEGFSLTADEIAAELDGVVAERTEFRDDTFNRETIIIRYTVSTESVVVEE